MAIDFKELIGEHVHGGDAPCPACRAEGALRGAAQWVRENGHYFMPQYDGLCFAHERLDAELMAAGVLGS